MPDGAALPTDADEEVLRTFGRRFGEVGTRKRDEFIDWLVGRLWPILERGRAAPGKIVWKGERLKQNRALDPLDPAQFRSEVDYAVSWFALEKWSAKKWPTPRAGYEPNVSLRFLIGELVFIFLRYAGDLPALPTTADGKTASDGSQQNFVLAAASALGEKESAARETLRVVLRVLSKNGLQGGFAPQVRGHTIELRTPKSRSTASLASIDETTGKRASKGRPPTGNAKSAAERQAAYRKRLKAARKTT
jgi:hypothetical protein